MRDRIFGDLHIPATMTRSLSELPKLRHVRLTRLPSFLNERPLSSASYPSLLSLQVTKMNGGCVHGMGLCGDRLTSLSLTFAPDTAVEPGIFQGLRHLTHLKLTGATFRDLENADVTAMQGIRQLELSRCQGLGWLKQALGMSLQQCIVHATPTDIVLDILNSIAAPVEDIRLCLLEEKIIPDSVIASIFRHRDSLKRLFLDGMANCASTTFSYQTHTIMTTRQWRRLAYTLCHLMECGIRPWARGHLGVLRVRRYA